MVVAMELSRVLVVEDEPAIRLAVVDALEQVPYAVDFAVDGDLALSRGLGQPYDLIVLDLMLPGLDGVEVCRRLREAGKRTPILMLTARGREEDRVEGLRTGADDYLCKPFSVKELLARCAALLRRAGWAREAPGAQLSAGAVRVDCDRSEVRRGDEVQALTARDVAILRHLARRQGKVVSKRELLTEVWGYPDVPLETRTVENTIGVLRRKLEQEAGDAAFIVTVRGAGFKLGPEVTVTCDG
jgi:DNA-binding response OmpR family regulator